MFSNDWIQFIYKFTKYNHLTFARQPMPLASLSAVAYIGPNDHYFAQIATCAGDAYSSL